MCGGDHIYSTAPNQLYQICETSGAYRPVDLLFQSTTLSQTEFVAKEFETSIAKEITTQLAQAIEETVRSLRRASMMI